MAIPVCEEGYQTLAVVIPYDTILTSRALSTETPWHGTKMILYFPCCTANFVPLSSQQCQHEMAPDGHPSTGSLPARPILPSQTKYGSVTQSYRLRQQCITVILK